VRLFSASAVLTPGQKQRTAAPRDSCGSFSARKKSYGVNRTVGNKVKSMIGKLFEVYDEAIGLGEHDLACVLQWVITAYAKRHDIPIGVDAFDRPVVEAAANHRRASIASVAREPVGH
jgi:hypothetical protein